MSGVVVAPAAVRSVPLSSLYASRPPSPPSRSDAADGDFSYPGAVSSHVSALRGGRHDERMRRLNASNGADWSNAGTASGGAGLGAGVASAGRGASSTAAPPAASSGAVVAGSPLRSNSPTLSRSAPSSAASSPVASSLQLSVGFSPSTPSDSNPAAPSLVESLPSGEAAQSASAAQSNHSHERFGRFSHSAATANGSGTVLSALSAALRRSRTPPPHSPASTQPLGGSLGRDSGMRRAKASPRALTSQQRSHSQHLRSEHDNNDGTSSSAGIGRGSALSSSAPSSPVSESSLTPLLTVTSPSSDTPSEVSLLLPAASVAASAPPPASVPSSPSPTPPPLFSPTFAHPAGVLLKEGLLQKQTPLGPRPVYLRLTSHPLTICEYDSDSSSHPSAVHFPDSAWQFGHNPSNHSILLRSVLFNVVLLCKDSAEHREWRQALLRVQTEINDNNEQAAEARAQRMAEEEEARRLIAERKLKKLERRRSAELLNTHSPVHSSGASTLTSARLHDESSTSALRPLDALSPSARSSSDVTASVSAPSPASHSAAVLPTGADTSDGATGERPPASERHVELEVPSESDEEGGSDSDDERAAALSGNGRLRVRRASTRSMSHDDGELSALRASRLGRLRLNEAEAAAGGTPPPLLAASIAVGAAVTATTATAGSGEHSRKLTDPLPSSSQPAAPGSYPSAVAQRAAQRDEDERTRRAEEKAAAYLRAQKSRAYVKLFSLPDSEELLCDYSCAVQRAILLHGRMYVSEHFVCFYSSIFSHKTSLVLPLDDVLFIAAAKVALVFDNSLKLYVQVGPLPIPVRLDDGAEADGSRAGSLRKSSTSSDRSVSSALSQASSAAAGEEDVEAEGESSEADDSESGAAAVAVAGPRFMLSTANTLTASFTLSHEQIAYLISVNHPNIAQHFFASFLTRDHALQLLDGILRQKHDRDGFTSLSAPTPLPTPQVSNTNSPASQSRTISGKDTGGGHSAEKDRRNKRALPPCAQALPATAADAQTGLSAAAGGASSLDDQHSMLLPASASQELPSSLSFSTPSLHSTLVRSQLPTSQSLDAVSAQQTSSRVASAAAGDSLSSSLLPPSSPLAAAVDDASQTDGGDEWSSADSEPASLVSTLEFGAADMQPPLGDFNDSEDALLLDSTFPVDALLFFHLLFADHAPFSLHSYHAQRATDSDFKMSRWRDIVDEPPASAAAASEGEARRREAEGDLLRRLSYRMQFVTPVGPPVTRVHRVQRWYAADAKHSAARLDSCSVTPDITFGDQVYILERMYVEPLTTDEQSAAAADSSEEAVGGVRVRVFGAVRFKSRPWKMKPFIGLIQQRSREDVKAGVEQWEQFVKRRMHDEPDKLEACRKRVAALRGKGVVEQLLAPAEQPNRKPGTTVRELAFAPRSRSPQPHASHDPAANSASRAVLSSSLSTAAQQPLSPLTAGLSKTAATASSTLPSSQPASLLSPAGRAPPSAFFSSSAQSRLPTAAANGGAGWLFVLRRVLPASWAALVMPRVDATTAFVSRLDANQRAAAVFFSLALLGAVLFGPAHRLFAVCGLLSVGLLACSGLSRLQAVSVALEESAVQLHTLQQLIVAIKLEQERSGAEQKDATSTGSSHSSAAKKRPVNNIVIDPTHFK